MARITRSTSSQQMIASGSQESTTLQDSSNARPKRRGRPPKGALAAKLKAKLKAASPLPPSSPTHSASSRWVEPIDSIPIATSDDFVFPCPPREKDEQEILQDDFESRCSSPERDLGADISTASDPFGFFQVERVLKQNRGTSEVPVYPTPDAEPEQPFTPSTPRRHRRRSPSEHLTHRAPSMPSSPSPVKPSRRPATLSSPASSAHDLSETEAQVEIEESPPPKGSGKGKGKQATGKRSLDLAQIEKEWAAVLPKRPRRARKQREVETDSDSEDEEERPPRRKAVKGKGKVGGRSRAGKKNGTADLDLEADEKFVKEREERIAYFKKLQSYEMSKENVFVV